VVTRKTSVRLVWLLSVLAFGVAPALAQEKAGAAPKPDAPASGDKPAGPSKPVKVFILLGQSNMVGMGNITGEKGETLEKAVKGEKLYPYVVDAAGNWAERTDVRNVQVMVGRGGGMDVLHNEWLKVGEGKGKGKGKMGIEFALGHALGEAVDEPVMLLKSCIGNRSLGWDLLPPGSERYAAEVTDRQGKATKKVFAGYKERPDMWDADPDKGVATAPPATWVDKAGKPIDWYAGKQYDDDIANAKKVLGELGTYFPGATNYEVAGFFFWQGEKDSGNAGHAGRYEQNLVRFIKTVRKDFNAPGAKFVLATLGEATKGVGGPTETVMNAQLAVDGKAGKYAEFKGNVATVYTHDMARGGSGNGHYGGNAKVYMDVGEAMGKAMVELLKDKQ
jgi:hypothetical protein